MSNSAMAASEELPERPVVKKLKEIDDKYLELQREFDKERSELAKRFTEKQQQFLVKRKELLTAVPSDGPAPKIGTPGLGGFWCKAIQHHEAFQEKVQQWDEPVLDYVTDIEVEKFDPESKGFKIILRFCENPYFTNSELFVEYHTTEANPYLDIVDVEKVVSSPIDWKPGQDVTIEKVSKKVKGGGTKKTKPKKEEEKIRPSFFCDFTASLHKGLTKEEIAAFLHVDKKEFPEEDLPVQVVNNLMESHYECGVALRDNIIPFAVRWYTGEACADDDDSDDEESEEEGSDGDEEGSDSEDDEAVPEPKATAKALGPDASSGPGRGKKKEKGSTPKGSPATKPKEEPSKEDCKQQ